MTDHWNDDVLGRRNTARSIYRLLESKYRTYYSEPGSGSLCAALDDEWGAGKSFFVHRFSLDIRNLEHIVVTFDAWANDLSEDPLIGFMSDLEKQLHPIIRKIPKGKVARSTAERKLKELVEAAPRATLSVGKVLFNGFIKKVSGATADEIGDALTESLGEDEQKGKAAEAALNELFRKSMVAHQKRQAAIKKFKERLSDLVTFLGRENHVNLPMFVLIDELDRCRPTYAIELLEGIKHLFDATGVLFVVSTNLKQLAASAQAVYGQQFDAARYLKRFFSLELRLPPPDNAAFARLLANRHTKAFEEFNLWSVRLDDALRVKMGPVDEVLSDTFRLISDLLQLDLRTQTQVFLHAEASLGALPKGAAIHPLYLFFLSAVFHTSRDEFARLTPGHDVANSTAQNLVKRDIYIRVQDLNDDYGRAKSKTVSILDILFVYIEAAGMRYSQLKERTQGLNVYDFPQSILLNILTERSNEASQAHDPCTLTRYHSVIGEVGSILSTDVL